MTKSASMLKSNKSMSFLTTTFVTPRMVVLQNMSRQAGTILIFLKQQTHDIIIIHVCVKINPSHYTTKTNPKYYKMHGEFCKYFIHKNLFQIRPCHRLTKLENEKVIDFEH